MRTIPERLRDHVSLDIQCVDRIYLNRYVPTLQTSGALVYFLEKHRQALIASPALLGIITQGRSVRFQFSRQSVFVKVYYFYIQDAEFGPGFIKIATYAPYPVKVCLNGHEWAKQQLRRLRLKGVIARVEGTHRYILTTYGRRVAHLMTKLHHRIFDVASATLQTTIALPAALVRAFRRLDSELDKLTAGAALAPAGI